MQKHPRRTISDVVGRWRMAAMHVVLMCGCACTSFGVAVHAQDQVSESDERIAVEVASLRHDLLRLQQSGRHQDAQRIREKLRLLAPASQIAAEQTGVNDIAVTYYIQQQILIVEIYGHLLRAEHLSARGDEKSVAQALIALDTIESTQRRIVGGLDAQAQDRFDALRKTLAQERGAQHVRARERTRQRDQQHLLDAVAHKQRRLRNAFEQRIVQIRTFVQRGVYEEALAYSRNLVRDYPGHVDADAMFMETLRLAHEQRALSYSEKMEDVKQELYHQYQDVLMPRAWDGWPVFTDDWQQRIETRNVNYYEVTLPDWHIVLMNKAKTRTDVHFEDMDIGDALDFLGRHAAINIIVDPEIRASALAVNVQARNMELGNILNWIAEQSDSQWQYFNEAIYFGAPQKMPTVVRIYDIAQVIFVPRDFPGVELTLEAPSADGGGSLFDAAGFDDADDEGVAPEDLMDLIRESVNPSAWDENDDWGISIRGTVLMVAASAETHLRVQDFVRGLRDSNDIQVSISAKWLTISDDYMEEIGMNWANEGSFTQVVGSGIQQTQPRDNSFNANVSNILPGTPMALAQNVIGKGLNLHMAFLSGIQSLVVFEAVEARQKGRILDQTDLTVKNGSRANVFMGRGISFIGDYDAVTGSGAGTLTKLDPVISTVNVGASLDIKPFVSSDRKYVTLDLRPDFSTVRFGTAEIIALQSFNLGTGGFNVATTGRLNGTFVFTTEQKFTIELPEVRMNKIRTRVIIPDKGNVFVGGFKSHLEQGSYAQVPVLGNIPFLGRLFGRRGIYESHQSLYLSVGAKIILYPELEALQ